MKVSVVGCGGISKCHLEALNKMDDITISSVVDIVKERADEAARKYNCKAYYDFDEMLKEDKPDSVHICTPHYLHVPMAVKALSEEVNVLCEKPCAISKEGLRKLRLAELMSNAHFGTCFQNRYNESVIAVKNLVDKKEYGAVLAVKASVPWHRTAEYYNDDWHGTKEKEGGGVVINQAIHTQDLMRYITGKKVKAVTAHVFNDTFKGIIEVEDTAHALFEYDDGTTGLYDATVAFGKGAEIMIDIICERATLRIEGNNAYCINEAGFEQLHLSDKKEFVGKSYWGNGHSSLISDFYDAVKNDRKFDIDAVEGGKAVEEFLAIYESSEKSEKKFLKKD